MPSSFTDFKKGQRYEVATSFKAGVLTQWNAPFTGGYEKTLPVGFRFVIEHDPPEIATAVSADPESPSEWEAVLVDREDIENPKFNGYYLVIPFEDVAAYCKRAD